MHLHPHTHTHTPPSLLNFNVSWNYIQCSPQPYLRHVGPTSLQYSFPWCGSKLWIDAVTGSTLTCLNSWPLKFRLGRTLLQCHVHVLCYTHGVWSSFWGWLELHIELPELRDGALPLHLIGLCYYWYNRWLQASSNLSTRLSMSDINKILTNHILLYSGIW